MKGRGERRSIEGKQGWGGVEGMGGCGGGGEAIFCVERGE